MSGGQVDLKRQACERNGTMLRGVDTHAIKAALTERTGPGGHAFPARADDDHDAVTPIMEQFEVHALESGGGCEILHTFTLSHT